MTYLAGGKQYIVLATNDARLVALALPAEKIQSTRTEKRP
jgi:hypothetical protein